MNRKRFTLVAGIGCLGLLVLMAAGVYLFLLLFPLSASMRTAAETAVPTSTVDPRILATQEVIPTLAAVADDGTPPAMLGGASVSLTDLYEQVNPGVVNIQVYVERNGVSGEGAGSGFILDSEGHVVTNNHVVADAKQVTVIFYNGLEANAEIVGTDDDSDLAVIKVDNLVEGAHPLPLGDSDQAEVGEWVVAIGNPFSLGGSMSLGIVSAKGRSIPSGVTGYVIPEAIQTDAAINPGNSGGPLLNLEGEVIGINAQIASGGSGTGSGVGFAIPSNIIRRVVPVLIADGVYEWPWLGVEGADLNLIMQEANGLEVQQGAYINTVITGGPADKAGLRGSSGTKQVGAFSVPVGGDVVIKADGQSVTDFDDLLSIVASKNPGAVLMLTILRDGMQQEITVTLQVRP
jgi:S1-C subfamily serine protease